MFSFFKKKKSQALSLDALYYRKYRRDILMTRLKNLKDCPDYIMSEQVRLVNLADQDIEKRLSFLRGKAMEERVALDNIPDPPLP